MTDAIVVGSGASAVHAAWPLAHAGLFVLIIDVGHTDDTYAPLIPNEPFSRIRRTDPAQHRYFLGDEFEGIPFGPVRVGAQLTPPRAFITRGVEELTPVDAPGFSGIESLAKGGLASGWGAGVARFLDRDLEGTSLRASDLEPHYRAVEERIGVCGRDDDLSPELGALSPADSPPMPPLDLDTGAARILERYTRKRDRLLAAGLRIGPTRLAVCTRPHRGRGSHPYHDMDFWADHNRAVYRPRWTLDELLTLPNVTYLSGRLALSFHDSGKSATLTSRRLDTGDTETHEARALVLAAGVMGTARIVLRSLSLRDHPLPLVANPYTYAPCINMSMLGREPDDRRHSLSQLTGIFSPPGDPAAFISIYSYRSLLTFKLLKEAPLGVAASLRLFRALLPMITILGIHHADRPAPAKSVALTRDDRLAIRYSLDETERRRIDRTEAGLLAAFRRLGIHALKRIRPGHGSSIHYAGTIPMRADPRPGHIESGPDGRLAGAPRIVIADGSLLPHLPAKGLTLTLMANADRIGTRLAERLK